MLLDGLIFLVLLASATPTCGARAPSTGRAAGASREHPADRGRVARSRCRRDVRRHDGGAHRRAPPPLPDHAAPRCCRCSGCARSGTAGSRPASSRAVAERLGESPAFVEGVVSFYTMYHTEPPARYVLQVCTTLSCACCGGRELVDHLEGAGSGIGFGETTADGVFQLVGVQCLGACGSAPVVQINDDYYENLDVEQASTRSSTSSRGGAEMEPVLLRARGVPDSRAIATYLAAGGYEGWKKALAMTPDAVTEEVIDSELRGRGGAGFPTGRKWSFVPKDHPGPALPDLQRRRVRARHVQGPRDHRARPAPGDRGDRDRLVRDQGQHRLHLHPRRVRALGEDPRGGDRRGARAQASSARTSWAAASTSTSGCTAAPAPTSAARRRR